MPSGLGWIFGSAGDNQGVPSSDEDDLHADPEFHGNSGSEEVMVNGGAFPSIAAPSAPPAGSSVMAQVAASGAPDWKGLARADSTEELTSGVFPSMKDMPPESPSRKKSPTKPLRAGLPPQAPKSPVMLAFSRRGGRKATPRGHSSDIMSTPVAAAVAGEPRAARPGQECRVADASAGVRAVPSAIPAPSSRRPRDSGESGQSPMATSHCGPRVAGDDQHEASRPTAPPLSNTNPDGLPVSPPAQKDLSAGSGIAPGGPSLNCVMDAEKAPVIAVSQSGEEVSSTTLSKGLLEDTAHVNVAAMVEQVSKRTAPSPAPAGSEAETKSAHPSVHMSPPPPALPRPPRPPLTETGGSRRMGDSDRMKAATAATAGEEKADCVVSEILDEGDRAEESRASSRRSSFSAAGAKSLGSSGLLGCFNRRGRMGSWRGGNANAEPANRAPPTHPSLCLLGSRGSTPGYSATPRSTPRSTPRKFRYRSTSRSRSKGTVPEPHLANAPRDVQQQAASAPARATPSDVVDTIGDVHAGVLGGEGGRESAAMGVVPGEATAGEQVDRQGVAAPGETLTPEEHKGQEEHEGQEEHKEQEGEEEKREEEKREEEEEEEPEAVVAASVSMNGLLECGRAMRMNGKFVGELVSRGSITVGPTGQITGDLKGLKFLRVEGQVVGDVVCDKVVVVREGKVHGDITAVSITVGPEATMLGMLNVVEDMSMANLGSESKTAEESPNDQRSHSDEHFYGHEQERGENHQREMMLAMSDSGSDVAMPALIPMPRSHSRETVETVSPKGEGKPVIDNDVAAGAGRAGDGNDSYCDDAYDDDDDVGDLVEVRCEPGSHEFSSAEEDDDCSEDDEDYDEDDDYARSQESTVESTVKPRKEPTEIAAGYDQQQHHLQQGGLAMKEESVAPDPESAGGEESEAVIQQPVAVSVLVAPGEDAPVVSGVAASATTTFDSNGFPRLSGSDLGEPGKDETTPMNYSSFGSGESSLLGTAQTLTDLGNDL